MRHRPFLSAVMASAMALSVVTVGLVASSGTSGAVRAPKTPHYYLSLGDSYSIGYQPTAPGSGATAGYTAYVAKKEKLTLENFGCGGATTVSIISATGCSDPAGANAVAYPTSTQEAAALAFIAANPGEVSLITISISGNDVTACANNPNPIACVEAAASAISTNVTTLVGALHNALVASDDPTAKIVGLTYPDVILGDYVYPSGSPNVALAQESVLAFDAFINPALSAVYDSVAGGSFVNVTQAPYKLATQGDDTPLATTAKLKPYGTIPVAVWEICKLTYFCTLGNIHANTKGYTFIGKLVVADLA